MKLFKYLLLSLLFFNVVPVSAQSNDTTIVFRVEGVCGQCKQRIQKALKIKGVRTSSWSSVTKLATVTYNPAVISVDKLHEAVAAVGHDTERKKAKTEVYKALPDCCLYRDLPAGTEDEHADEEETPQDPNKISGLVSGRSGKDLVPLPGATIQWLGTNQTTVSNEHGEFSLNKNPSTNELVISYSGFRTDTLSIGDMNDVEIILRTKEELTAVVVRARVRTSYIDGYNPFRTTVITKKELLKAACCNLSESFETNPSVDVSYNDAATGSKQIQLLGLSGIYTQLTVENFPGPRGIATLLGLNSIPGPWIESIQLIKGTGSVINGYESIAGQINIELRKPQNAEKLYLNGYINSLGKTDINLNIAHKLNSKWSTAFLLHDDFMLNKKDENGDGFREIPTGNQFSAIHRWQYLGDNGLMSHFGFKALIDDRTGGEMAFDPSKDKGTTNRYGLGIRTNRFEAFAKTGYVFPEQMYKSIGLQVSAFWHDQDSYFGLRNYNAKQNNFYSNLIYQSRIGSDKHKITTGASFVYDNYDENLQSLDLKRTEITPGVFGEYTFKPNEDFDLVAGFRTDNNSLYGWFATPRLNIRYAPFHGTTLRLSAGRGQRTASVIAENLSGLVSSRSIVLPTNVAENAYGLQPEVAWNKGISLDQNFKLFGKEASLGMDFYRNDFINQVIVDMEDPRTMKFYNLQGKSYSNSFQAELNFIPVEKLEVKMAYRFFDVKATYGNALLQKPLTARHRAFTNLAYDLKGWKFDYTVNITGEKRIPSTLLNPVHHQLPGTSPAYVTMNAQVSKSLGKKKLFDLYLGGENLTNYMQHTTILAADQPFGDHFDASMIWGPVSGRMFYTGFRYSIK
jgi:outer membrane receptor for ferrienterochelin and colicins